LRAVSLSAAMRLLRRIAEDEMIAVFLRAELDSARCGDKLRGLLTRDGREESVLRRPDLGDLETNAYRRALLDEHRAYERRDGLFLGFPRDVAWFRAALERDELLDILYVDWDWWLTLSGGSRRPRDAARRIRAGRVAGVTAAEHEPLAEALREPAGARVDRSHDSRTRPGRPRRGTRAPHGVRALSGLLAGRGGDPRGQLAGDDAVEPVLRT
jgi:hypothetical protein